MSKTALLFQEGKINGLIAGRGLIIARPADIGIVNLAE